MITLFAVMNGDEVADSFDQMTTASPVMSQIFWYTYVPVDSLVRVGWLVGWFYFSYRAVKYLCGE